MSRDPTSLEGAQEGMVLFIGREDRRDVDLVAPLAVTAGECRHDALEPSEARRRRQVEDPQPISHGSTLSIPDASCGAASLLGRRRRGSERARQ